MEREHYRPFDPIAAQAGAPYGHKNLGIEIKIYEYFDYYCIGAQKREGAQWEPEAWSYQHDYLVMLPEATCQGKPVYRGDTLYDSDGDKFQFEGCHTQSLLDTCTWEPAKKWPETTLSNVELSAEWNKSDHTFCGVANAAIAHACETGQVVPMKTVKQLAAFCYDEGRPVGGVRFAFELVWKNASAEFFGDK